MYKDYENRRKRNALDIHSNTSGEEINNFWCLTHNKNYIAHEKMPSRLNTDAACVTNTLHLVASTIPHLDDTRKLSSAVVTWSSIYWKASCLANRNKYHDIKSYGTNYLISKRCFINTCRHITTSIKPIYID